MKGQQTFEKSLIKTTFYKKFDQKLGINPKKGPIKGQVTIEVLSAVVILLLLFVAILFFALQKNSETDFIKKDYENQIVCQKISGLISYIYSNSKSTQITFALEKDANVFPTNVTIGNYYCFFSGRAQPVNLVKGNVKAQDINGLVVMQNV